MQKIFQLMISFLFVLALCMQNTRAQNPARMLLGSQYKYETPDGRVSNPWEDGWLDASDIPAALNQVKTKARQGDVVSQVLLGQIYYYGLGVPRDHPEALQWYLLAADLDRQLEPDQHQDRAQAMLVLSVLYENGSPEIERDREKGLFYFKKAAEQDLSHTLRRLTDEYTFGVEIGTIKQLELAEENLRKACHIGFQEACAHMQNMDKSILYLAQSAQQGDIDAQIKLGNLFMMGQVYEGTTPKPLHGTPQNYQETFKWYSLAAKQGSAQAQLHLGMMYAKGLGVKKTTTLAKEYLRKACDNGLKEACKEYDKLNTSR